MAFRWNFLIVSKPCIHIYAQNMEYCRLWQTENDQKLKKMVYLHSKVKTIPEFELNNFLIITIQFNYKFNNQSVLLKCNQVFAVVWYNKKASKIANME